MKMRIEIKAGKKKTMDKSLLPKNQAPKKKSQKGYNKKFELKKKTNKYMDPVDIASQWEC